MALRASSWLGGAHVSAACAEASSCKCMQVLSCLIAERTFGRCRKADQEWTLKPSAFGLRLRKLAGGKGLLSSQECARAGSRIQALQRYSIHPRHQGSAHSHLETFNHHRLQHCKHTHKYIELIYFQLHAVSSSGVLTGRLRHGYRHSAHSALPGQGLPAVQVLPERGEVAPEVLLPGCQRRLVLEIIHYMLFCSP